MTCDNPRALGAWPSHDSYSAQLSVFWVLRVFSVCSERADWLCGRCIGLEQPQPVPQAPGPTAGMLAVCGAVVTRIAIISVLSSESVHDQRVLSLSVAHSVCWSWIREIQTCHYWVAFIHHFIACTAWYHATPHDQNIELKMQIWDTLLPVVHFLDRVTFESAHCRWLPDLKISISCGPRWTIYTINQPCHQKATLSTWLSHKKIGPCRSVVATWHTLGGVPSKISRETHNELERQRNESDFVEMTLKLESQIQRLFCV